MVKPKRKRPRSRAETKQATREALIEAGIEELGAHGLDASLDAICARAGLTRGAFYVHFADREAFVATVMQHVLGGFVQALMSGPPATGTAAAIDVFVQAAKDQAPVVRGGAGLRFHHLMEACRRSKVVGDTYRGLIAMARDRLAGVVAADQQSGQLRTDAASTELAGLMVVTALGMIASLELELPIDIARLGPLVRRLIEPGA